jgi:SAM-dependent methyltransferase
MPSPRAYCLKVRKGIPKPLGSNPNPNFVNLDPGRIEGIDVDEAGLARCRQRGLPCRRFDLEREDFPAPGLYEVVVMRHVIEHLRGPLPVFEKLFRALKPDDLLFVLEEPA